MKLRINDDFYYPDVYVCCNEDRGDQYFKSDPVLIAEVLSPSTQRYDRGDKRQVYLGLASLQEYVLISQTEIRVEIIKREGLITSVLQSKTEQLVIESLDFSMTLADLYA